MSACDNDERLLEAVAPYHGLVRMNDEGYPIIIQEGAIYVTAGTDRRSTGTHYTPPELTQPVVRYTLEPLVYEGPAEGLEPTEWKLRSPKAILDLKVCDMACGSGAFLVQACRYLSERLVEAWQKREEENPGRMVITPEGELSAGDHAEQNVPREVAERMTLAMRLITDRCLYGVDKNLMAVEMAKLSLWLVTMEKQKAFEFLDHAIKVGDTLLGVTNVEQIVAFHPVPEESDHTTSLGSLDLFDDVRLDAMTSVRKAGEMRSKLEQIQVVDVRDVDSKRDLYREAEAATEAVKLIGDAIMAATMCADRSADLTRNLRALSPLVQKALREDSSGDLFPAIDAAENEVDRLLHDGVPGGRGSRSCFHWPLEFPEVFVEKRDGFDAIVGNPPFQGGQKITGELGTDYRNYLVQHLAGGRRGSADLAAYFFLRAGRLLNNRGYFGLLATNTICQGDTREVGLQQILERGVTLIRAVSSRKWPGGANLEVSHVWAATGTWVGGHVIDETETSGITSYLASPSRVDGEPIKLAENKNRSFQGSIALGMGFVLPPQEAAGLLRMNKRNREVLFPYLNGQDLNSRPDQSASRWVINFFDWPLERTARGSWEGASRDRKRKWLAEGSVPHDYSGPVAADYPECLKIVEEQVKPERLERADAGARRYWWRFLRPRPALYKKMKECTRVLVRSRVANLHAMAFIPTDIVVNERLAVFVMETDADFAVMQSTVHEIWARKYSGTLRTDMMYAPSDCFETFPFPQASALLGETARRYTTNRQSLMLQKEIGLTDLYGRYHDPDSVDSEVRALRESHAAMDRAVIAAYGWDMDVEHQFAQTAAGTQFTFRPDQAQELLDRLLERNHELSRQCPTQC